jgi:cation diffusion facilitator family transporter
MSTVRAVRLAAGSVGVACVVLAAKLVAWWLTGSVALLADALESVVNVAAAGAALAAIRFAAIPPDANHPYGHTKVEYFSAVLEGVLIGIAAFLILREAWVAFGNPQTLAQPGLGLLVSGLATCANAAWATVLFRQGRQLRSPALIADANHLLADVVTSIGVFVGVALVVLTGVLWLDALVAALTAVNILWSGLRMVRASVAGLMDEAVPPDLMDRIRNVVSLHAEGAIEAHDLRTRRAGPVTFIEFHLVVSGEMRVLEAHAICDRIEAALKQEIEQAVISIHVEPEGKAKHKGVLVL